jgi:hypothetical protein
MRSRLSLAVGLVAACALNVATPANAHHGSKHSQLTTPKAGAVKHRVRRGAGDVSRAYGQAPYDARDTYYGDRYYGGPYYGDGGGAYYGDAGFGYRGYGQAPFESSGPTPRQARTRANASDGAIYNRLSTEVGATQGRLESSGSPAAPATRPAARQRTRASTNASTDDARSAYGQAPSERSARPASNQGQSGQSGNQGQSGQCFISMDSDRGQGYYGDCSTKGARQVK